MPIPTVQWAQRKDKLYLTIDVQDVKDEKINLKNADGAGVLSFRGTAGKDQLAYELDLTFNQEINVEESKVSVSPRHIFLVVMKTEEGHWPRLTKDKHAAHIKCDWDKWVDEDEEDEKPEMDMSNFNFSGFGGEGGMGGMGGMMGGGMGGLEGFDMSQLQGLQGGDDDENGEDSDNEELPDLVK